MSDDLQRQMRILADELVISEFEKCIDIIDNSLDNETYNKYVEILKARHKAKNNATNQESN